MHRDLVKAILSAPVRPETFLVTEYGKAFADAGFGNWSGDRSCAAGPGSATTPTACATRRLAKAGCFTLEIMAITGHKNIA